jgi:Protein of unknown function (DUF3298)
MSSTRVVVALVIAVVAAGGVGCGTSSSPPKAASATAASASAATTQPSPQPDTQPCTDIGGTVDSKGICRVHTVSSDYTVHLSSPTDYPEQQALTEYLTQRRDQFVDFVTENPRPDFPCELDVTEATCRSGAPDTGTQSVVFTVYSDSGGAHPVTDYKAFTYDLAKQAPITFDSLFKPGTDPVNVLDPIVRREMEKRWQGNGSPLDENILGEKVYQDFALTDDAVIFFIGQGEWLPQAAGPNEVTIPRTELAALLA